MMKKLASLFVIVSVVCILLFSCGGGGGGVDEAIDETFTVSYDANGAESGAVPAAQKGSEKSPIIISDNTGNLHKNGYVFCGWRSPSLDLFNPGTSYNGKNNANYSNDKKKLTLYAAWEPLFNYNVINPGNPAPSLNGMQKSPSISYAEITGLTVRGLALSNIEIPWSMDGYQISSIHSQAFYNNANIQSISIPESVTSIGFLAFYGCSSIASITIPSSVTNIGHEAFSHCSNLSNLILLSSTPPVMGEYALAECPVTVSVPAAGVDEYKAAEGWNTYSASINGYSNETYTVTFDGQGATTAANPASIAVVPPNVTVGSLPSNPDKTGYIFGGWYKRTGGTGGEFTASTVVSSNMTVYANWEEYNYTVEFDDQGATTPVSPTSKTVASPNTTVDSLPTEPSNTGYYFGGWNTKSDGTGTAFTASTTVTDNITVYAIWMNNPTRIVTFDSQGATTEANPTIKQVVSPAVTIDSLPTAPKKTGYGFGGWFREPEGAGGEFTTDTVVTDNIRVYAKWTANVYQITYKDKGGSAFSGIHGNNHPTTHTYGNDTALVTPSKEGYTFGGWFSDSNCEGSALTKLNATLYADNIILYAKWTANVYPITYKDKGDSAFSGIHGNNHPTTHTYGTDTVLVTPSKERYKFDGWYTDSECTGSVVNKIGATSITSGLILYAKWTPVYAVIVNSSSDGTVTASSTNNIIAGTIISLSVSPNDLCVLNSFTVKDESSNTINLNTIIEGTNYSFVMPTANVNVSATFLVYSSIKEGVVRTGTPTIGDIVLQSGNTVSTTNYKNKTNDYNTKDGAPVGIVAYEGNETAGGSTALGGGVGLWYMVQIDYSSALKVWHTLNGNNSHGKIVKLVCQDGYSTGSYSGYYNTYEVIGNNDRYPAFQVAYNYHPGNTSEGEIYYTGWFLPMINELSQLFTNLAVINNSISVLIKAGISKASSLPTNYYVWSSSQAGSDNDCARKINFGTGGINNEAKNLANSVIIVRALDD